MQATNRLKLAAIVGMGITWAQSNHPTNKTYYVSAVESGGRNSALPYIVKNQLRLDFIL